MGVALLLRHDLEEDPHVLAICQERGMDPELCVMTLRRVWRHADKHTQDGWIPQANHRTVDMIAGFTGFAAAMEKVGWLEVSLQGVQIPDFHDWLGEKAIKKLAGIVEPRGKRHKVVEGFEEFWKAYPKKMGKDAALRAWCAIKPKGDLLKAINRGLERDRVSEQWTKQKGRFIPYAATWLNGKRWEDDPHEGHERNVGRPGRLPSEPGKFAHLSQSVSAEAPAGPEPGLFDQQATGDQPDSPGAQEGDPLAGLW